MDKDTMALRGWRDKVLRILADAVERAEPTGSNIEPRAITSFSVELIQYMIDEAPKDA
jgi:hypothetical protein